MERALSTVLFVPVVVVTVPAFAAVIRRLLGVRVGLVRVLPAAALAMLVTAPILSAFAPADPATVSGGEAFLVGAAPLLVAALLAMAALVVLEVLLPTGSLPGPVEAWKGARRRVDEPGATRRSSGSCCGTASAGSCGAGSDFGGSGGGWPVPCGPRSTRAA